MKYYNINGKIVKKEEAFVHVSDLALHRGYSIFDYCRVINGKALFIDDYLDRFENSAAKLSLALPVSRTELKEQIKELIRINEVNECGLKLILTGGYSEDGYLPAAKANLYILLLPTIIFAPEIIQNGIKLMSHDYTRHIPSVKMTNYVESLLMRDKVKAVGAMDLLYHADGQISESSRSNFFILTKENVLVTTFEDILYGITRKHVLELVKDHYKVEIRPMRLEEVRTAKEAFLTSSAKGALAVVQVDDWQIGDGKVGAVTQHISKLYDARVKDYVGL